MPPNGRAAYAIAYLANVDNTRVANEFRKATAERLTPRSMPRPPDAITVSVHTLRIPGRPDR
jgi:hypothetical protein